MVVAETGRLFPDHPTAMLAACGGGTRTMTRRLGLIAMLIATVAVLLACGATTGAVQMFRFTPERAMGGDHVPPARRVET